jgi:DNA-binding SARP family transcriptional activator
MTTDSRRSLSRSRADDHSRTRRRPKSLTRSALDLLRLRQYEQLVDLVRQADEVDREPPSTGAVELMDAACCLGEACLETQREAAWHEQAIARLVHREKELNERLAETLHLFEGKAVSDQPRLRGEPLMSELDGSDELHGGPPVIAVHCLGRFEVYFDDLPVTEWPNGKGKAIFKFLVTRRNRMAGKEILMNYFWPNASPDAARNNLNVAVYAVRRAFAAISQSSSIILFRNDSYLINPEIRIWIDYEAFLHLLREARSFERTGQVRRAVDRYRCAEALYRGEFLEEDRYEDWIETMRASLRDDYLGSIDRLAEYALEDGDYDVTVTLCNRMLQIDPCHENPHQRLMRCWSRQGVPHLAIRQYHICRETLRREVGLEPSDETKDFFELIRQRKPV